MLPEPQVMWAGDGFLRSTILPVTELPDYLPQGSRRLIISVDLQVCVTHTGVLALGFVSALQDALCAGATAQAECSRGCNAGQRRWPGL